jgi:hypothetical protein
MAHLAFSTNIITNLAAGLGPALALFQFEKCFAFEILKSLYSLVVVVFVGNYRSRSRVCQSEKIAIFGGKMKITKSEVKVGHI